MLQWDNDCLGKRVALLNGHLYTMVIQEIKQNFSKEIQQIQDTINRNSLNVIFHPSALNGGFVA